MECLFSAFLYQICRPNEFRITTLMFDVLRWDPAVKAMSRPESNKMMLQMFRGKSYARSALSAFKRLLNLYERRQYELIEHEMQSNSYTSASYDQIIRRMIVVIRADIAQVFEFINIYIEKKEVESVAFYSFLNETFKRAIQYKMKWYYYLSMNGSLDEVIQRSKLDVPQWLVRADMGFSYEEYKKDHEQRKERDRSTSRIKNVEKVQEQMLESQNNFFNRFNGENATTKSRTTYNNNTSSNSYTNNRNGNNNRNNKPKHKGFAKVVGELNDILLANGRTNKFDSSNYCPFWNNKNTKCKFTEEQCKNKHRCSNCGEPHILETCPTLNKPKV